MNCSHDLCECSLYLIMTSGPSQIHDSCCQKRDICIGMDWTDRQIRLKAALENNIT
jgi:hypothetical protein